MNNRRKGRQTRTASGRIGFKGFTLIEMMLVMGIIGVLVSISSLAIAGFVRSANIRSYNSAARQGLAAVQNCLIQWEINGEGTQDGSVVDLIPGNATPSDTGVPDKVRMNFIVELGKLKELAISNDGGALTLIDPADPAFEPMFKEVQRVLEPNIGSGIDGLYNVEFSYEHAYTANWAAYEPADMGTAVTGDLTTLRMTKGALPGTIRDYTDHVNQYRQGVRVGLYPYRVDMNWA